MKFKEIASRLTGISCPVFGISWNPPAAERTIARRVITFLEDRRVLYSPNEQEIPHDCVSSVIEIRQFLTERLQEVPAESELGKHVRAMRTAARAFLETVQRDDPHGLEAAVMPGHWSSWSFHAAIGELRGAFGIHLAQIATTYGLDVEDDLSRIFPRPEKDGGGAGA